MTSRSRSGTLPGSLREGEIDQLSAPGRPPEPLQEGSGEPLEAESAPKGRPEASREPFWSHFASILDPPGHHFPRFPAAFSVVSLIFLIVFSPPPSALLFAFSVLQALRPQLGGRFWGASPCEIRPLSRSGSTGGRGAKRIEDIRENPDKTQRLPCTVDSLNPSHGRCPPAATGCSWGHFGLVKNEAIATGGLKSVGLAEKSAA